MYDRVVFAEFTMKCHIFLKIKNEGVGPKNLIV